MKLFYLACLSVGVLNIAFFVVAVPQGKERPESLVAGILTLLVGLAPWFATRRRQR